MSPGQFASHSYHDEVYADGRDHKSYDACYHVDARPTHETFNQPIQSVNPIDTVASSDAEASSFAIYPTLSLESVIVMLISAGPTSKGNAEGGVIAKP